MADPKKEQQAGFLNLLRQMFSGDGEVKNLYEISKNLHNQNRLRQYMEQSATGATTLPDGRTVYPAGHFLPQAPVYDPSNPSMPWSWFNPYANAAPTFIEDATPYSPSGDFSPYVSGDIYQQSGDESDLHNNQITTFGWTPDTYRKSIKKGGGLGYQAHEKTNPEGLTVVPGIGGKVKSQVVTADEFFEGDSFDPRDLLDKPPGEEEVVPSVETNEGEGEGDDEDEGAGAQPDHSVLLEIFKEMGIDIPANLLENFSPEQLVPFVLPLIKDELARRENVRTQPSVEQRAAEYQAARDHELSQLAREHAYGAQQGFAGREHEGRIAQLGNEQAYGTQALQNIGATDVQRLQNYGTTIQANRAMSTPEGYASYVGDSESPIGALKNYQTTQLLRNTGGLGANLEDALRVRGNEQDQARALAYIQSSGGLIGAGGMINPELARHQQNLQRMQSTGGYDNPYDFMMTERLQAVNNPYAWLEYQGMKDQMMADRTAWQDQYGQMGQQGFGSGNNIRDIMFRDGAPAIYPENMQKTIRGYESRVAQPQVRSDGGLGALENQGMLRWIPGNQGYSQYQAAQQARQNRADTQANQWFTMATPPEVTTSTSSEPSAKPGASGDPSKKYDPFHPYYMDGIT